MPRVSKISYPEQNAQSGMQAGLLDRGLGSEIVVQTRSRSLVTDEQKGRHVVEYFRSVQVDFTRRRK